MAMFGGSEKKPAAPVSGRSVAPAPAGLSIIGTGMTVHGDIETGGIVKIEGAVNGHVTAAQQVLIAKGGQVEGDVDTGEAVVGGTVRGAVHAGHRVEVQSGAVVQGDITTARIAVAEGAVINGAIRMGQTAESPRPAPARPVAQPTLPRPSTAAGRLAVPPRGSPAQPQ